MLNLMRAIHDVVERHGSANVAEGADFASRTLLLQKANPDYDSHRMNVQELHRIMKFTNDFQPLKAWAEAFGFELVAKEQPEAVDVHQALSNVMLEIAEVTVETHTAMADGRVDQMERARILREIAQAQAALDQLKASVRVA